jgi:dimethylglycine dehydrogenase
MCLADDVFLLGGSGYLQNWHMRWFAENLSGNGVEVRNVSDEYGGIAISGPQARQLLARLTRMDVSNGAFAFLTVRRESLAGAPCIIARLSVTGELGYEIYVPTQYLSALLQEVSSAAEDLDARYVGFYALNSLRLEKSFGIWSREYSRDYTPRMSGLSRFIDYQRRDFLGCEAALIDRSTRPKHRLVALAVDAEDADATGYEPVFCRGRLVGFVTSGGYGHTVNTSLAMGYIGSEIADGERGLSVTLLGESRACRILPVPMVDAAGCRMRS